MRLPAMVRVRSPPAAGASSPPAAADVDVSRRLQRVQRTLADELGAVRSALPRDLSRAHLLPAPARARAEAQLARTRELEAQLPFVDEFLGALLSLQRRCRQTRLELDGGSWLAARSELHDLTIATDELAGAVGRVCDSSPDLHDLAMAQLRRLGQRVHGLLLRANAALPSGAGTGATDSAIFSAEAANLAQWGERGPSWLYVGADGLPPSPLRTPLGSPGRSPGARSARSAAVGGSVRAPDLRRSPPRAVTADGSPGVGRTLGALLSPGEHARLRRSQLIEAAARRWADGSDVQVRSATGEPTLLRSPTSALGASTRLDARLDSPDGGTGDRLFLVQRGLRAGVGLRSPADGAGAGGGSAPWCGGPPPTYDAEQQPASGRSPRARTALSPALSRPTTMEPGARARSPRSPPADAAQPRPEPQPALVRPVQPPMLSLIHI